MVVSHFLLNLDPEIAGDGKMLAGGKDKLPLFQGGNMINIDDTVAAAGDKLGVAGKQLGEIAKTHVGTDQPVRKMDQNIVVGVICVKDAVNRDLYHNAAFLYLDIMGNVGIRKGGKILHSLKKTLIPNGLHHIIQSPYLVASQGIIPAAGCKNNGTVLVFLVDAFGNREPGGLIFQENI